MGKKVDVSDFINDRGDPTKFKNCTPESVEAYSLLIKARLEGKLDHKTNRDIARMIVTGKHQLFCPSEYPFKYAVIIFLASASVEH